MTDLNEAIDKFCRQAKWAHMDREALKSAIQSTRLTAVVLKIALVFKAGSLERANLELRRAEELPPSVLARRIGEATNNLREETKHTPQHIAAVLAGLIMDIEEGEEMLARGVVN